jgi:hypothetical protein
MLSCRKSEHDDMASEHSSVKPAATGRKPLGTRVPLPPLPQIQPPLQNGGQELVRDSHC